MSTRLTRPFGNLTENELRAFQSGFRQGQEEDCWLWQKALNSMGYGEVYVGKRVMLAHRLAWTLANGSEIPPGHYMLHSCDTPSCVNPHHLRPGTQKENSADARKRGRWSPPPRWVGEKHPMAKLTNAQMVEVGVCQDPPDVVAARYGITPSRVNVLRRKHGNGIGRGKRPPATSLPAKPLL